MWIIFCALIGGALWLIFLLSLQKKAKAQTKESTEKVFAESGFQATDTLNYGDAILFINKDAKQFAIQGGSGISVKKVYSFSDFVDAELNVDGNTVTKASLGRMAVGAAFGGSTGALLGAASSKKGYCTKIAIDVTVNDFSEPHIRMSILDNETKMDGFVYNVASENAQKILSALMLIKENQ